MKPPHDQPTDSTPPVAVASPADPTQSPPPHAADPTRPRVVPLAAHPTRPLAVPPHAADPTQSPPPPPPEETGRPGRTNQAWPTGTHEQSSRASRTERPDRTDLTGRANGVEPGSFGGRLVDWGAMARSEVGQATAEYALVMLAAAALAGLLLAWASGTDGIGRLLDAVLDSLIADAER